MSDTVSNIMTSERQISPDYTPSFTQFVTDIRDISA